MQRKLLFLINPVSGTKKKPELKKAIAKRTAQEGCPYTIIDTRIDGDYAFLRKSIREENITDVIICGGDGSVGTVTSFLLDIPVSIGIIPTGSGNGLALAAGIPYSTTGALNVIFNGRPSSIDGFLTNGRFSCMMCGIGSDAQVAHDFARQKTRGLKTYLRLSAMHYFKSKPRPFTIRIHDTSFDTEAFFITVANSNQFGNHFTIAPAASLTDGLLDIVIVRKMHKLVLPFALLRQITGTNAPAGVTALAHNKNILYFQAAELTVLNPGHAPVHIDGEPQALMDRLHLKILPNAFRLLQP